MRARVEKVDVLGWNKSDGILKFILLMVVLKQIIWILDDIMPNFWDIRILQELFYTGKQTSLTISIEHIMIGLMNIIILFSHNKITPPALYSFNRTQKVLFVIRICLIWFRATFILHLLYLSMQPLLHMNLNYLLLEGKMVSIYWMRMTLPSHTLLIQLQTH